MTKKKRRAVIVTPLVVAAIRLPIFGVYRQIRQARLDRVLIYAIEVGDNKLTLEALSRGANGESRDNVKALTLREALHRQWDHVLSRNTTDSDTSIDDHLPALLLFYHTDYRLHHKPDGSSSAPDPTVIRSLLDHGTQGTIMMKKV